MISIGMVGVGKICRDQHVPAVRNSAAFVLTATASPHGRIDGVPAYPDIATMLASEPGLDAVALCQPPLARHAAARLAIEAGKHVFLEKPPGATLAEIDDSTRSGGAVAPPVSRASAPRSGAAHDHCLLPHLADAYRSAIKVVRKGPA